MNEEEFQKIMQTESIRVGNTFYKVLRKEFPTHPFEDEGLDFVTSLNSCVVLVSNLIINNVEMDGIDEVIDDFIKGLKGTCKENHKLLIIKEKDKND